MAKNYIIIDSKGRASVHTDRDIHRETTTRLGTGESFQVFEATPLKVKVGFEEAPAGTSSSGTKRQGRPVGKKKTRKAKKAGKKASKKASKKSGKKAGKKTGKVGRPRLNVGECTVAGCGKPAKTRGLCSAHYQKHRRLVQDGKPGLIAGGVTKKKAGKKGGRKKKATRKAAKKTTKKATKTAKKKSVKKATKTGPARKK